MTTKDTFFIKVKIFEGGTDILKVENKIAYNSREIILKSCFYVFEFHVLSAKIFLKNGL